MSILSGLLNNPISSNVHYGLALASRVERRRRELRLSVERAAELAGMETSEWCALEYGWVPTDSSVLRAVAGTLEASYLEISFLAEVSEYNQSDPV